ncbi:ATP-binding cassette sub-family G member 4-like [Cloeon dipterum]|uniref:ATP-binding cassette sub-family G member 4-like n=1 Tax=Cloeon dipterum TaxID=197152 RepID=UPI00321FD8EC
MDENQDGPLPDLLSSKQPTTDQSWGKVGIKFEGISLLVRNAKGERKEILSNLHGLFPCGQLSAIIGPSGSGKSSLLEVLAGLQTPSKGCVLPQGQKRRLIAQECVFPEVLTAYEALTMAAALKLDAPVADRRVAVRRVLRSLNLTQCAATQCVSLSGGQRKRLSIALELIDEPPVLLLDEPTTGLDYVSGMRCVRLLQDLSRTESRTIVCTIHQPSALILELIDNIYLLASGSCLHKGSVDSLLPKLGSFGLSCPKYHNPADFALDVACGEHGSEVVDLLAQQQEIILAPADFPCELDKKDKGPATSFFTQFSVLLRRSLFVMVQDKVLTVTKILVHIVIAILLGVTFYNFGHDAARVFNNGALLVCLQIFLLFSNLIPTVLTFPLEKAVFKREFSNCWYSMEAFYLARFVAYLPLSTFNSIIFTSIVYWMTDQPMQVDAFFITVTSAVLTGLNAQSMGILVGTVTSLVNGMFLASLSGIPQFVFCGYFITLSTTHNVIKVIAHCTSYTLYSYHAMVATIYGRDRPKLHCDDLYCYFRSPKKFLDFLGVTDEGVGVDLAIIFGFLLAINLATYSVMKYKYAHLQR